jgi:predicted cupin superfamily sugar epimerase
MNIRAMTAADLIRILDLRPHPEGGWYREIYRSDEHVNREHLPARYSGARAFATSIYYLLEAGQFSAFHRLRSDEIWYHHAGGDLEIVRLTRDGQLHIERVGPIAGQWQSVIPHGDWFAARPVSGAAFALVGCAVAPGFDFADFEMGNRAALLAAYPHCAEIIESLTRR